jgi:hypothetical protein
MTPVRHYFEALNTVDHRTPIPAMGIYVNRLLSKFNRLQLASVARYLWDNVGLVFLFCLDSDGELFTLWRNPVHSVSSRLRDACADLL